MLRGHQTLMEDTTLVQPVLTLIAQRTWLSGFLRGHRGCALWCRAAAHPLPSSNHLEPLKSSLTLFQQCHSIAVLKTS